MSLADKLDTIVGLFAAGEKPTGSRDPYGLRRAAQGVVKILADLPALGMRPENRVDLFSLVHEAYQPHASHQDGAADAWRSLPIETFMWERTAHLLESRGFKADEIRAVGAVQSIWSDISDALARVSAIASERTSEDFQALAILFKRVKNITKGVEDRGAEFSTLKGQLVEPAELALLDDLEKRWPAIYTAQGSGEHVEAIRELARLRKPVDRFFADVLVMADEPQLRNARLGLLTRLRDAVLRFVGDIAEIAADESK